MDHDNSEVLNHETGAIALVGEKSDVDMQVATAHKYPRSIKRFIEEAEMLATLSEEVAESCGYALPRREYDKETRSYITKTIEGPTARFAEIVLSCWGNARAGTRIVDEGAEFVTAGGFMFDLQRNVAIEIQVPRRITNSKGERYKTDMIGVTANAAASIALRNAVLKVIPKALWDPIYQKAKATAVGTEATLSNKRSDALKAFQKRGASAETIFEHFGVNGIEDITLEHLALMKGYLTAIKDGDSTVEQIFNKDDPAATGKPAVAMPKAKPASDAPPPAGAPVDQHTGEIGAAASAPSPAAAPAGVPAPSGNGALATAGERQMILKRASNAGVAVAELMERVGIAGLPADLAGLTKDGFIACKDALAATA